MVIDDLVKQLWYAINAGPKGVAGPLIKSLALFITGTGPAGPSGPSGPTGPTGKLGPAPAKSGGRR